MQGKKQWWELDMEQRTDSKLGEEYVKVVYCHPAYLTYMQTTSCEMPGWMNHKLESRLWGEISISSHMHVTSHLWQKVKRGEWKSWLKTQHSKNVDDDIQSHHSMANRWGNNGNSDRLYFGGSKITVDSDCRHEIKRHLLLGRKAMTNLDSILKSRDTTLPTKVCIVKTMFSSSHVKMWELNNK